MDAGPDSITRCAALAARVCAAALAIEIVIPYEVVFYP
jgi:hypothetical protein